MIYHRFNGDWGYSQQAKATRCVPSCPACHFCPQTIRRILYSVICFYYDGNSKSKIIITKMEGGLEEAGWRYILQPNLEKMMPFSLATLLTSVVWVGWHIPLFFMVGTSQQNMNIGAFFIFLISFSFSLAVIRKLTKSVWLCVLFHAALNAASTVFAMELSSMNTVIFSLSMIIISLSLLKIKKLHHKE